MRINETRLLAACRVVYPELQGHPRSDSTPDQEEFRSRRGAAVVRLRTAIAALSGVNVDADIPATNQTDIGTYAMVPARLVSDLKAALLNGPVIDAMGSQVGPDRAAALLAELDMVG